MKKKFDNEDLKKYFGVFYKLHVFTFDYTKHLFIVLVSKSEADTSFIETYLYGKVADKSNIVDVARWAKSHGFEHKIFATTWLFLTIPERVIYRAIRKQY